MKMLLRSVLVSLALLWSGLAWVLHSLAADGGPAVVRAGNWLMLPAESVQWLAEMMTLAGPAIQLVVIVGWVVGMLLLAAALLLLPRTLGAGTRLAGEGANVARALASGQRPALDPMLRDALRRKS